MLYIILSADYHNDACLRHEFSGESALMDVGISTALSERLINWNQKYYAKLMTNTGKNCDMDETDVAFDQEGVSIAIAIQSEATECVKIKYYSELLMRYLSV